MTKRRKKTDNIEPQFRYAGHKMVSIKEYEEFWEKANVPNRLRCRLEIMSYLMVKKARQRKRFKDGNEAAGTYWPEAW